jgi:hypothetical protein
VALLLAAMLPVGGSARAADLRPAAEPAKSTSTTGRLKAKKRPPAASLDRQTAPVQSSRPAAKVEPRPIVKSRS